jgi:hypothetical protein
VYGNIFDQRKGKQEVSLLWGGGGGTFLERITESAKSRRRDTKRIKADQKINTRTHTHTSHVGIIKHTHNTQHTCIREWLVPQQVQRHHHLPRDFQTNPMCQCGCRYLLWLVD